MYINTGELEIFLLSHDPNEEHFFARIAKDKVRSVRQIALDYYANKIVSLANWLAARLDRFAIYECPGRQSYQWHRGCIY